MKAIDPLKVSQLSETEYQALLCYSKRIRKCSNPDSIPNELTALAFAAMRNCGCNVKFPNDMVMAGHQINAQKKIIESLRSF